MNQVCTPNWSLSNIIDEDSLNVQSIVNSVTTSTVKNVSDPTIMQPSTKIMFEEHTDDNKLPALLLSENAKLPSSTGAHAQSVLHNTLTHA